MFDYMLKIYLSILITFCFSSVIAQTPYGNDWINPTQQYFKIKVAQQGIYRLNHSTLSQQIPTLGNVNPKNFQLYKNGKEVAIYVQGESDNTFGSADFIEFYGEPNDGTLDKDLYPVANTQPHNYHSLFTDTAAYFLTINNTALGKRIQNFQASKTGLTSENFILYESLGIYPEAFYQGRYVIAHMSLSDYQEGEGFMGATYGLGGQQIRTLPTPNLFNGGGSPAIKFETYVAGRSDAQSTNPQGNNHHLRISIGNGSSNFLKKDTLFRSYAIAKTTFLIEANELGQNTQIIYESVNDLGAASDFQAIAYAKITYPRTLDLQSSTNLNFQLPGNSQNRFLNFSNNNKAQPVIWDLTTNQRITGAINGSSAEFVLSASNNTRNFHLYDGAIPVSPTITKVEMINFAPSTFDKNFIIVTNKKLLSSAQNYATYRQQSGYKPYIITTEQLYDQFYYGVHHPLSIKNFAKYLLQYAGTKPEYLLLLGKGLENHLIRSPENLNADLVPTYGSPPSDDLLTARINSTSLAPAIATGRVSAQDNQEVEIYLQKLKTYEQYPDDIRRKKIINVSGGRTLSENTAFTDYQKNMYDQAKEEYFGADSTNFHKKVNDPVTSNGKQKIINEINQGATLLSYLGHGSHQVTEVDFGNPNELNNQNALLFYLVNGCTTGNSNLLDASMGEKHILYPDKGAIGWIGTSSEGVASYLHGFSRIFYKKVFNEFYGRSVATTLKEAKKQYQNLADNINIMHTTQYTFLGDPAVKFYSPQKTDYAIEDRDLFIYPNDVTSVTDSFAVAIVVKNIGKAIQQPLEISISRTLPDNSIINYPIVNFTKPIVYNTDTLYYFIKNEGLNVAGINKFVIKLDPQNKYDELSETNNTAILEYNMASNGINNIFPKNYAIVNTHDVELVAQSSNLLTPNAIYLFEIDTVKTFNSTWKKTSGPISAGFMPKWKVSLPIDDDKVYYWRAKLNIDIDKGGSWKESSFTYIKNSQEGWNQSHIQQLQNTALTYINFNGNNKKFEFVKSVFGTSIQTRGDAAPTVDERRYRSNPRGVIGYRDMEFTGFTILALKPNVFTAFSYPSIFNQINNEGDGTPDYYSGQYYFNINNPVEIDSLIGYIHQIPNGYFVYGYNGRNIDLSSLPATAKNAFQQLGVSSISSVNAGEPYMFFGQKGTPAGTAIERTADYNSPIPARSQLIRFEKEYPFPFNKGQFFSMKAGPALKWHKAYYKLETEATDVVSFDLIGYDKNGLDQVLMTNIPQDSLDISNYDATTIPHMAIRANIIDDVNRTPPQISKWKFIYDEIPENSINPEIKYSFYKDPINEGDSLKLEIAFQNISNKPSDSTEVFYTITKADRSILKDKVTKVESLKPFEKANISLKLPSIGLTGKNLLKIDFKPINGTDSYLFNNFIQQPFTVLRDNTEPMVDVVFDGKHIMNGEIISPQPNIMVNITDENAYILLNDTTIVNIYLKSVTGDYKRIAYSSGLLTFTPASAGNNNKASIVYKPNKLADGIYTLMVEGKDASSITPNMTNYTIDFEIINESAITHFYPYPNPFTTAMKFVFTLTGEKIPDKIKVQITTVTGKIVREVFKEELGSIRIGNNISDFTWNGTDMYGDRLANGVYFYKVIVENNDKSEIKHRKTNSDAFFKKNTGKIYLMR